MVIVIGSEATKRRIAVEPDTYVNLKTTTGIVYENVRFVDLNRTATAMRCVAKDGINEYPLNLISDIQEVNPQIHKRVVYLKSKNRNCR